MPLIQIAHAPLQRVFRRASQLVVATVAAWLLMPGGAAAQQRDDLLIGASLPLTGNNAAAGQLGLAMAKATFDAFNASGGLQGRKIRLVALDDGFSATKAAENARLLDEQGALALFNCWGTASCSAMLPVAKQRRLPMVAGIAGGGPMRSDPGRYAFNVRPTTADELDRILQQMTTIGQTRVALVYQDDPFGKSGQAAAQPVLRKANRTPVGEFNIAADGSNAASVVADLQKSGANGVVVVASPPATLALISNARKAGHGVQFYNLAAQANRKLIADLGANTSGVVFTTLVPSPWKSSVPVVKDYQTLVQAATGRADFSYLGLEIYINARVLIEGLRQAGPKVDREGLVTALETMGEKSFGGVMHVRYGAGDRDGSAYVGLAIAGRGGRFIE